MDLVNEAAKGWSNPGISNIYEKTRPDYNIDSVEFLLEKVGALEPHLGPEPFTIVELGAGTGKFTRAVLKLKVFEKRAVKNFKIISMEPLKEMCEKFKEMVPNVEILQCAASDLNGMYGWVPIGTADTQGCQRGGHWGNLPGAPPNDCKRVYCVKEYI